MISKNTFVRIMDGLRDFWDELRKTMQHLGVVFEENYLTRVAYNTLDALCREVEANLGLDDDVGPWCYYFAFELDWGRGKLAKNGVHIDGEVWPLENAGQLYDLLMLLNDRENKSRYAKRHCPECGAELEVYYDGPNSKHHEQFLIRHCAKCLCDWESYLYEDGKESALMRKFWG